MSRRSSILCQLRKVNISFAQSSGQIHRQRQCPSRCTQ